MMKDLAEIIASAEYQRERDAQTIRTAKGNLLTRANILRKELEDLERKLGQCMDNPTVAGVDALIALGATGAVNEAIKLRIRVEGYRDNAFLDDLIATEDQS